MPSLRKDICLFCHDEKVEQRSDPSRRKSALKKCPMRAARRSLRHVEVAAGPLRLVLSTAVASQMEEGPDRLKLEVGDRWIQCRHKNTDSALRIAVVNRGRSGGHAAPSDNTFDARPWVHAADAPMRMAKIRVHGGFHDLIAEDSLVVFCSEAGEQRFSSNTTMTGGGDARYRCWWHCTSAEMRRKTEAEDGILSPGSSNAQSKEYMSI